MKIFIAIVALSSAVSTWAQDDFERERPGGAFHFPPLPPLPLGPTPDSADTNFIRLFSFTGTNGSNPYGNLIEGSDGRLYGTTIAGGLTNEAIPEGMGTVFAINKDGTGYKVLHYFKADGRDGQSPYGGLVEGRYGALFGITKNGGKEGKGTIFKLNKNGRGYYVIRHFTGGPHDGSYPQAGLLRTDSDRLMRLPHYRAERLLHLVRGQVQTLYGTTTTGGSGDFGTVFRLKEDGSGYSAMSLASDNYPATVRTPAFPLVESGGVLYGGSLNDASTNMHGTVFRVSTSGTGFEAFSFALLPALPPLVLGTYGPGPPINLLINPPGLSAPSGVLLDGGDGWVYGTAAEGGARLGGGLFRFPRTNFWDFSMLHSFGVRVSGDTASDGVFPSGGLMEGEEDALYGTTYSDFSDPRLVPPFTDRFFGSIFKINKDGSGFVTLKKFMGNDGANPQSKLLLAGNGIIYGTTSAGGDFGLGTVFAFYPR